LSSPCALPFSRAHHTLNVRRQNYNPTNGGGNDYRIDAFTADPAAAYHNYTCVPIQEGWLRAC
jgi:hypothetical protein